jgi:hypothetical protein
MKITACTSRFATKLLCFVLILTTTPLYAGTREKESHEAFMRGGKAIAAALEPEPRSFVPAAVAADAPVPPPRVPQMTSSSRGLSKPMWATLIGGFAASGIIIYKIATGPGASIRNCGTCSK